MTRLDRDRADGYKSSHDISCYDGYMTTLIGDPDAPTSTAAALVAAVSGAGWSRLAPSPRMARHPVRRPPDGRGVARRHQHRRRRPTTVPPRRPRRRDASPGGPDRPSRSGVWEPTGDHTAILMFSTQVDVGDGQIATLTVRAAVDVDASGTGCTGESTVEQVGCGRCRVRPDGTHPGRRDPHRRGTDGADGVAGLLNTPTDRRSSLESDTEVSDGSRDGWACDGAVRHQGGCRYRGATIHRAT